jgi:sugar-specific transcriptional regulator TrmB
MKEELRAIGLTDGEIEVYLALLKLGESTNSPIARHTQFQSSTVYYCLNTLIEKGFVTYILKGNRKHFRAVNPDNIISILDEKEKEFLEIKDKVKDLVPQLKGYEGLIEEKTTAEVYEGFNGMRMIFRQILDELKKGEQYEAFVIEQNISGSKELELLFTRHNKDLKSKGIKLKLIAPARMKEVFEKIYGKRFLSSYQEIRYTTEVIPVGLTIYKNNFITHTTEKGKPLSIKIRNEKLSQMYRDYFSHIWKNSAKG